MAKVVQYLERYNAKWPLPVTDLEIEMRCIQAGGRWHNGYCGAGLFHHYRRFQELVWPELDHHRWSDLILQVILDHKVSCILGAASTGKTHCAARYALTDYFCFPNETTVIVSSTDLRGLELRVWGELKMLLAQAQERFPELPGIALESKHSITTEPDDDDAPRDLRNGIICVPCMSSGGQWLGIGKVAGTKNKRVRMVGDELAFMREGFLQSVTNLDKNPDFKAVFLGNPIDPYDQLGIAAEPKEGGWDKLAEPQKTTMWSTKFYNGIALNLVGTDSPNFDYPDAKHPRYRYLISAESMQNTEAFYGKDSLQYYSQCKGVMKTGIVGRRVIPIALAQQFNAFDEPIWGTDTNAKRTKVYAIDAAYGFIGGDRCVGGWIEFGKDKDGRVILACHEPVIIPVSIRFGVPEDQIAKFVMDECERLGIPPHHVFFDATGRGSLGTSFARIWSPSVNPIEFGGSPTSRIVCEGMNIIDPKTRDKRAKLCHEHYSKFVSELWFSVRYLVESNQLRGLTMDVAREFALREWKLVRGDKIEVETKDETKKRMGRSPDLADWLATCCEGARRLGFKIARLSNETSGESRNDFLRELQRKSLDLRRRHELKPLAA